MANLNRLPKGYLPRVKEAKVHLIKCINNINKSTTFDEQLRALTANYSISNKYITDGEIHLSFDFGVVSSEFIYKISTRKWELFESCTVFIDNSEDFVDNYRW